MLICKFGCEWRGDEQSTHGWEGTGTGIDGMKQSKLSGGKRLTTCNVIECQGNVFSRVMVSDHL